MRARYSSQQGYVLSTKRAQRQTIRPTQRRIKFGPTAAKYLGLGVLAVLAVVMLSQSTGNNTAAYDQSNLRKDISEVNQNVESLKLEAKRATSVEEVQKAAVRAQMTPMPPGADFVEGGEVAGVSTLSIPSPTPTPTPSPSSPPATPKP
jgi:hypothetical protein